MGFTSIIFYVLANYSKKNKTVIGNALWISFLSLGILFSISFIFLVFDIKYYTYASILLGLEEIVNYLRLKSNRVLNVTKCLIFIQIFLVALKLDYDQIFTWE